MEIRLDLQGAVDHRDSSGGLNIEGLQSQLETLFLGVGNRLLYLPVVESTNTLAMQVAHERSEEGVVVLTDSQTAGKGRQGRRWVDISGRNVLSSILLRPLFPPYLLVMAASLAVFDTIFETCGIAATIKWPNDILIGDRKVAGILIETSHDLEGRLVAVLGIGVNVNGHISDLSVAAQSLALNEEAGAQELQGPSMKGGLVAKATTLETECGRAISREVFIAHMLWHIEISYLALQEEANETFSSLISTREPTSRLIRERWRSHLSTLGHAVKVHQGNSIVSGVAEDVDGNGELLLRRHSGELVSITWGDVEISSGNHLSLP